MRIISLNTWDGRALHPLLHFFERHRPFTDIFCLQEVHNADTAELRRRHPREFVEGDAFRLIAAELPYHRGFHATFPDDPHRMALAMFIHKNVSLVECDHVPLHEPKERVETGSAVISPRRLQYAIVQENRQKVLIANYHGIWRPGGKLDSPERLEQSQDLMRFLDRYGMAKVLCGDFNLEPDTKSLHILEQGMQNLVKQHAVTSTRTPLYREFDNPEVGQYADYALVTPDVMVNEFRVLPDVVSDHAPLYLDFTVGDSEDDA